MRQFHADHYLQFTATQSTFVLTAGPIDLTVNFLSPVEVIRTILWMRLASDQYLQPHDLVQQSIPFSYMTVTYVSNDGASHSVQVYSDISAEWASGDRSLTVNWNTTVGNNIYHQVQLANPSVLSEKSDQTQCEYHHHF
jgi:hemolysin-activating ACP:hemolysin acyltransferase